MNAMNVRADHAVSVFAKPPPCFAEYVQVLWRLSTRSVGSARAHSFVLFSPLLVCSRITNDCTISSHDTISHMAISLRL